RGRASSSPRSHARRLTHLTVMVRWVMGPAPSPGNADPTPLNITSVTRYVPGVAYACVGFAPDAVVPSPHAQKYVMTGLALTVVSPLKLIVWPGLGWAGANANPLVNPLCPVVTIAPVPADVPSTPKTVTPIETAPADGNVCEILGVDVSTV